MQTLFIICIILLGFSLIMADLLFIPGGIVAVMGGTLILGALISSYRLLGSTITLYLVFASLLLAGLITFLSIKLKLWRMFVSKQSENKIDGFSAHDTQIESHIGKSGQTVSALRPAGTILIEGKKMDAITSGNFIDQGKAIVVTGVSTGQLIVKES